VTRSAPNPYLETNFAPVAEEVTAVDLPVEGNLPAELCGRYMRNGPNPATPVDPSTHHWFVGDGMVHAIRIDQGKAAWYRNRYVGSSTIASVRGTGDIDGPNWNNSALGPNTNVCGFSGRTWALVEAGGVPVELTYELETVGRNNFDGSLPNGFTAHPKIDPTSGEMHAMAYAWPHLGDHVQYIVVSPQGKVSTIADIAVPAMTMMHDMSITNRYAVIYDQPVTVDFDMVTKAPLPFSWNPDHGNRVGFLPRSNRPNGRALTPDIVWIDAPLGYCFHPLNAFDDPLSGHVIIDLCIFDKMFDSDRLGPFGDGLPRLERWTVDVQRRTISVNIIDETPNEFPRHRDSLNGLPYRYGYTTAPTMERGSGWPTIKHDLVCGARTEFDHGPGRAAGEAVFVPRGDSADEDDGWLLTLVHDLGTDSTDFVVIDAQDFNRGYIAKVRLPQRVPFGFHGNWVSD